MQAECNSVSKAGVLNQCNMNMTSNINSVSIRQEIQRFESVHPCIYAVYDLLELLQDPVLAQNLRDHVVSIEDSFVNSQEWTMSRSVPDLRLGIVGSINSGKSALVHRYLTGSYMQEESPEGGRFKKEVVVDNQSYLLLIRDEGGPPEMQFAAWVDAVIFVFSLENEASFNEVYSYYNKMAHLRNSTEIPFILVGTQDTISEANPRVVDDARARKLAAELRRCSYYETCATYGLNVERVFQDACQKIVQHRLSSSTSCLTPNDSRPSTPLTGPISNAVLRAQPNASALHGAPQSPSMTHNQNPFNHKETLTKSHHPLSSSSNQIHRANDTSSSSQIFDLHGGDHARWHNSLVSHASTQGLVTIATENNNIAKFVTPACLDSLQLPSANFQKDSKDLPTPSSTPTTSRKSRRRSNLFTPSKKGDDKFKNGELGSGRAIPIKQGYLYKKSSKALNKEWKKKYVALCDDGRLTYHPSINDYMENVHGKEISLQYVTVKVPGQKPRGSKSIITTLPGGHSAYNGSALHENINSLTLDDHSSSSSIIASTNGDSNINTTGKLETPNVKKRHRRMKSSGLKKDGDPDDQEVYEFCIVSLDGKRWRFEAGSCEERDAWVSAVERQILASLQGPGGPEASISRHIHLVPGNNNCIDCDAQDPDWASLNLGVLMCIECSGVHRNLGSHISRVRSLELDEWPPGHLSVMLSIGNTLANSVWEADLKGHIKPVPNSPREDKEKWIRMKYEHKMFLSAIADEGVGITTTTALSGRGLGPLLTALAKSRPIDVNRAAIAGRSPLHLACAAADLPISQLLIWNNANPNLLDSENLSCLQLARIALNQIHQSPARRTSHLQVTCPIHETQQTHKSHTEAKNCICSLLNMLSPVNSANSLVELLIALQNNTIVNSLAQNQVISVNSVGDPHGSGTSLNSNNSVVSGFLVPRPAAAMSNGRCHLPSVGGGVA